MKSDKGAASQRRVGFGYSETYDSRWEGNVEDELDEHYIDPNPELSIWDEDVLEDE